MRPTTTTMPSKDPISSSSVTDRSGLSAARGSAVVLLSPSLFRISSPVGACHILTGPCLCCSHIRCCGRTGRASWAIVGVTHADATCAVDDRSSAHEPEDRGDSLRSPLTDQEPGLPPHGPHSADRGRCPFAGLQRLSSLGGPPRLLPRGWVRHLDCGASNRHGCST